jgi:hemoglobin
MKNRHLFKKATGLLIFLCISSAFAQEKEMKKEQSLYDRLGGTYAIATVIDDFIERLLINDVLNANPAIKEARARVPKAGLKYRVTSLVCQVTEGPEAYAGRSMKDAHKHLNITEREWAALRAEFKKSLEKFNVAEKEQNELFAIVESTKKDIVVPSSATK